MNVESRGVIEVGCQGKQLNFLCAFLSFFLFFFLSLLSSILSFLLLFLSLLFPSFVSFFHLSFSFPFFFSFSHPLVFPGGYQRAISTPIRRRKRDEKRNNISALVDISAVSYSTSKNEAEKALKNRRRNMSN